MEFLESEFQSQDQSDAMLVQDIYNLSTVQKSIDDAFAEANLDNKMSSEFLSKVAEISLYTQPNVDSKTSGVEFICRKVGLQDTCKVLQEDMEKVYGSVNNQSLDAIMVANVGEDVAAQQRWMDDLANSALDSALPMFMQDAVFNDSVIFLRGAAESDRIDLIDILINVHSAPPRPGTRGSYLRSMKRRREDHSHPPVSSRPRI